MKNKTSSFKQRQKEREAAQRRRRLLIGGGIILVAVLVVVGLIAFANRPTPVGEFVTVPTKEYANADGSAIGPADAKVVVTEFADFQCPYCRQFHDSVLPAILSEYVDTGKIRYEYKHFIVIDGNVGGNESRQAAEASECAANQGRFMDYFDMLYANQSGEGTGAFSNSRLKAFAQALGLDTNAFNSCFDGNQTAAKVTADEAMAQSLGLNSTPSLLVDGIRVQNPLDINQIRSAIDGALSQ